MKKLYLLVLFHGLFNGLIAQNFEWAKVEGKYAYDYGYGITTDMNGNIYVAGKYEEEAIFTGNTLPNQGNHDSYLAKYSPSGDFNWIRTCGGFNGDYAHAIAYNQANNVYVAGEVEDGNAVISFPGSTVTLTPAGDNDVFIASYDLNGNLEWARIDGYRYNEKALSIACDNSGNIVICGYYKDTTKFDGKLIPSMGLKDMFVAKYDANGNILWVKNAGGAGDDEAKAVMCDGLGNIYVCGMYSDGAIFGTVTYTTANTPYGKFYDGYVAKYDPEGTLLWLRKIEGDYDDVAWSITKDNGGKIYVSGEFSGAKFDGITDVWPNGRQDAFVVCYDQNGNYQWVSHGGGPVADRARGIGCDGTTIFLTGQFGLNATFGSASVSAADSSDIFISALDNAGNFLWTKTVGGIADTFELNGYESGIAICATPGIAYVTGTLLDGGTFDNNNFSGYKRTDIFVAKLSTVVGMDEISKINDLIKIYPNPTKGSVTVALSQDIENGELILFNTLGQMVLSEKIDNTRMVDLSYQAKGLYSYRLLSNKQNIKNGKIVIE